MSLYARHGLRKRAYYPPNHVSGKDMGRVFFRLVLVLAGLVALILWSNSQ